MRIFDCFSYHNEDLVLDIRLNTLDRFIEKFIIVESKYDHQGNKKNLNFDIKNFTKFKDKIIYLVIDSFPDSFNNWERENYQRNYLANGFNVASDNDYLIISDVDEIPNLKNMNNFDKYKYSVFNQKMFYFKINLLNVTQVKWYGSRMCKKKNLLSPQWLRSQKIKKKNFWNFNRISWNIINNGGWHFSYLMKPEQIKKKISSFAHAEYNNSNFNTIEKIERAINNKKDIFGRDMFYEKVDLDETFPEYILNNQNKFINWIL